MRLVTGEVPVIPGGGAARFTSILAAVNKDLLSK